MNKTSKMMVTMTFALGLLAPTIANAAPLNIDMTTNNGSATPAATIIISKSDGTVLNKIDYPGNNATIDKQDVPINESISVEAQATGWAIPKKTGTITSETSGGIVHLVAQKAANINITFQANDITDYSGITATLHKETIDGDTVATVTTTPSNTLTISNVPSGTYVLKLDLPVSIQNKLPTSQNITVPENPTTDVNVTVSSQTATSTQTTPTTPTTSTSTSTSTGTERTEEEDPNVAQTGDPVALALGISMGTTALATTMIHRNKKKK